MLSFHLNATDKPAQALLHIREAGMKAGLVINPDMPVESLYPYLHLCDHIILMSVYAGFGGQKFIEDTYERVRTLKAEIDRQGIECHIQVDGGVDNETAELCKKAGANVLVAGSYIFKSPDVKEAIDILKA